jgi:hypothetical protein
MEKDLLATAKVGSRVLVVNSRNDIHCFRFSFETVLSLKKLGIDVTFVDFSNLDPSRSLLSDMKLLVRNLINAPYYSRQIGEAIKRLDIRRIKTTRRVKFETLFFFKSFRIAYLSITPEMEDKAQVAVHSWISTKVGNTNYKWGVFSRYHAFKAIKSRFSTINEIDKILKDMEYDTVFTFNGRFPVDSAILYYCQEKNIQYYLFDGGSLSGNNYNRIQYFSKSPHSSAEIAQKIDSYWESAQVNTRIQIAHDCIEDLLAGKRALGSNFIWRNQINEFEYSLDWGKTVVFYASSDWEQGAINEWLQKEGFTNQFQVVESLIAICSEKNLNLIVKLHPIRKNYKGNRSNEAEAAAWKQFQHLDFVYLLGADHSVDPISLAKKAAINIGYRTSLTAQTMYLSLPTIITGNVSWRDDKVNSNFATNSRELGESIDVLLMGVQPNFDLQPILKWAHYQAVCGTEMVYSRFTPGKIYLQFNQVY